MTDTSSTRTSMVAFLAILALSAATMLWLFWRFPLTTSLVTIGVLAALGVSARLARSIDTDMSDLDRGEQSV
jgi:hypothetical protein